MVGNDTMAGALVALGLDAGCFLGSCDQGAEKVDVVVVVLALQHRCQALEAHAGVDRRTRQVDPLFLGDLLVLHEDEVPDLDETVTVLVGRAGRSTPDMVAMVVEDFRAWAAGPGIAHGPEVVARRNADDAVVGEAGDLLPEIEGFVVGVVDRDQQALGVEAVFPSDQVPGKLDGVLLEVIAKGEVAEHFEEGVVARGVADIVEVVVLAAGAHAFLRGHGRRIGTLFQAGEDVLELHHAGIGEHQCRVVARHQRARRHDLMTVPAEIVEKGRPDFIHAAHLASYSKAPIPARIRHLPRH
ncbi:hypothetical protein D9M68_401700 [compost metagenome]